VPRRGVRQRWGVVIVISFDGPTVSLSFKFFNAVICPMHGGIVPEIREPESSSVCNDDAMQTAGGIVEWSLFPSITAVRSVGIEKREGGRVPWYRSLFEKRMLSRFGSDHVDGRALKSFPYNCEWCHAMLESRTHTM
jgi:hypothetical protein